MKLFISPHNDDETLFGAFTLLRERTIGPSEIAIAVVFDSYLQPARGAIGCEAEARRAETEEALVELGIGRREKLLHFFGRRDDVPIQGVTFFPLFSSWLIDRIRYLEDLYNLRDGFRTIFHPAYEYKGNAQHNAVAEALVGIPASRRRAYMTYTEAGKSRSDLVSIPRPEWIERKLRALACYRSQIEIQSCREHFTRDLVEYYQSKNEAACSAKS